MNMMMDKLLILVPEATARLRYIFSLIAGDIAGFDFLLTENKEEFLAYNGHRFSYGVEVPEEIPYQAPEGLLFSADVKAIDIEFISYEGMPAFMKTDDPRSLFPFDIFSASFYLVSRYEEYTDFTGDKFGRFSPQDSISVKGDFLHLPLVNLWGLKFREKMVSFFPDLTFRKRHFRFIPTIDIDHAYAYLLRSFKRTIGGYGRSVLNGRPGQVIERSLVLARLKKDPYDTYEYINRLHNEKSLRPVFFMLFAHYGGNDNNVSLSSKKFRKLLGELQEAGEVGIHPSLASNRKFERLDREIWGLSKLLDEEVTKSRQHFLKFRIPLTYRNLISAGITDDYSMGYSSRPGFRAGIATPFYFFDLTYNQQTKLLIHPLMIMDVTLHDYLRLNTQEAITVAESLIDITMKAEGEFISLWHNESFAENGRWKGWREVYTKILDYCC